MGGGDKCLKLLHGQTLVSRIIERVSPQVSGLILNANGNDDRFSEYKLPVVPDSSNERLGPLAGILAGMEWIANNQNDTDWMATFPGDAPFIPENFVSRCLANAFKNESQIVCAESGGRTHPVCALWRVDLADDLRTAMEREGARKIDLWTSRHKTNQESFATDPFDPFFNINRTEDLDRAALYL